MQVVHGLWTTTKREGPGLVLWSEDAAMRLKNQLFEPISDFTPGQPGIVRGRTTGAPNAHPYSLDVPELNRLVKDLLSSHFGHMPPLSTVPMELMLPTEDEEPLPSPHLDKNAHKQIASRRGMALEPWRVKGIYLTPAAALKWLASLNIRRKHPKIVLGESVAFWKEASNLVFYSLIHGTYYPSLHKVDHQIRAKWAMNATILANQLDGLQKRMPASCEAEWQPGGTRRTRESIVRDFFDTSIDYLVRHVVGNDVLENLFGSRGTKKKKKQNPLDSLAPALLKALYGKQTAFSGARDVQAAFVAMTSNWLQQSGSNQGRKWVTCFSVLPPEVGSARLEDLDPDSRVWRVAFSLQNSRDNAQHIYAQEIWENLVPTQTSDGETLSERFLKDMGRALQYFPELRESLDDTYPTHIDLTTEEIYRFFTEQVPHLQQADFSVVLPNWWKKDAKRLKTTIRIDSGALGSDSMMGFDSMVDFTWKASIDGRNLTDEAFRKLVKHKMALLPMNGRWVEIKPEDLWTAVNFFHDKDTSGRMTLREVMSLGMKGGEVETGIGEVEFDYQGTLAQLFENEADKIPEVNQPVSLKGQLRPYQLRGLSWLVFHYRLGFGACLADDMGLGKTIQLLSLLLFERDNRDVAYHTSPTLLVCPMSVVTNWYREAAKFAPDLRVMIHHGTDRYNKNLFMKVYQSYDLIITTYHLVNRDAEIFDNIRWHRVALDEAQNIKNPQAQQSQAILALNAENRIALTGTPVENKLSELWSIMEFLNPGFLGSLKGFQTKFAVPIERQQDKKKAELLRRLTQPFILRRLKTDKKIIQDLPEKNEMKVYCDLVEEQAAMYQAYVDAQLKSIEQAEGIQRNQLVLTTLMKLKQICNHPRQFQQDDSEISERSGKLMRLTEMLEEALEEGDKSLIFTQFTKMGELLETYLAERFGEEILFMHGGISQNKRQEFVDRFQDPKGPKLFILTVKTGGTGLNLTAATHVFHYDRWWNPAVENQATDRAFRIGQKRNVQVHKLIATGTLEDRIDMLIEKKKELAENIIGTDESWLTQLSTDALKDILTLSRNEA